VKSDSFDRLQMSDWIIFHITFLNWEFLLKWYDVFRNFLKERFLAVHCDFRYFYSLYVEESEILECRESDILERSQPCLPVS